MRALGTVAACTVVACSGADKTTGLTTLSTDPYASLRFNVHTVTMSTVAPYDTLQLSATAYTLSGATAAGLGTPTFTTRDTTLAVSATGLVTARTTTPSEGSYVIASLRDTVSNVTRADTVYIVVTDTAPSSPLATFAIRHLATDSSKVGVYDNTTSPQDSVFIVATAADGTDLRPTLAPMTAIRFTTSDANTATVTTAELPADGGDHPVDEPVGIVQGVQPGKVIIKVATTYYGVTRTDSTEVTIGNPVGATILLAPTTSSVPGGGMIRAFNPNTVTIGVGGTIVFRPAATSPLAWDVVFDDPSAAQPSTLPQSTAATGTGNIGPLPMPDLKAKDATAQFFAMCLPNGFGANMIFTCAASRSFPHAGTYHFHSVLYGTSGEVIVQGP